MFLQIDYLGSSKVTFSAGFYNCPASPVLSTFTLKNCFSLSTLTLSKSHFDKKILRETRA